MSLTVNDLADLRQLLIAHPEWRRELRPLILGDEIESLPDIVRDLAEAQRRSEQRFGRVEQRLEELAEAQLRSEQRFGRVEQRLEELAEAQTRSEQRLDRVEQRLEELAAAQARTEQRVAELSSALIKLGETVAKLSETVDRAVAGIDERLGRVEERVGSLWGFRIEMRYRNNPSGYFGRWIKRPVVADTDDLREMLEPHLTADDINEALLADLILRGHWRREPRQEVWLVVEVSGVVDRTDVERAVRRCEVLRRAGLSAVPVVAGERSTLGGEDFASANAVAMLKGSQQFLWDEAAAKWLAN